MCIVDNSLPHCRSQNKFLVTDDADDEVASASMPHSEFLLIYFITSTFVVSVNGMDWTFIKSASASEKNLGVFLVACAFFGF